MKQKTHCEPRICDIVEAARIPGPYSGLGGLLALCTDARGLKFRFLFWRGSTESSGVSGSKTDI